jgi:formylglycine-generating enzyme required for sulfatase activity
MSRLDGESSAEQARSTIPEQDTVSPHLLGRLHIPGWLLMAVPAVVLGVIATVVAVRAQDTPKGNRYALLIGVKDYDPNELHGLAYTEADVSELAKTLQAGGYEPVNVLLMTQELGAKKARFLPLAANIRKELKLLLQDLEPADSVVVALAGHGVQFAGEKGTFFCPMDARLADRSTLIPLDDVYRELEGCKAGLKMLLVDACRNDPRTKNSRARSEVDLESLDRPQVVPPPGGVLAFFSCSAGEKAQEYEELGHGVFFHFVIKGLGGEADLDRDGLVSPEELAQYAKRRVRDYVRAKNGVRQMPELKGEARDLVALVNLARAASRPIPDLGGSSREFTNSIGMKFVLIKAGEFLMGSPDSDRDAFDWEKPQHRVRITRPFYLGVHEVTRGQFRRFVDEAGFQTEAEKDGKGVEQNPRYTWREAGFEQTDEHPVVNVSWNDAVAFAEWLGRKEGKSYRLPTEAEWEYACRAGTTTRYVCGDDPEGLAEVGNVADGTAKAKYPDWEKAIAAQDGFVYTAPVGRYRPNAWGLYDMHGNVWEWCWDWYDKDFYKTARVDDPAGPLRASGRVIRGGSWGYDPRDCRSAYRSWNEPGNRFHFLGFRLAAFQSGR